MFIDTFYQIYASNHQNDKISFLLYTFIKVY